MGPPGSPGLRPHALTAGGRGVTLVGELDPTGCTEDRALHVASEAQGSQIHTHLKKN